MPVLDFFSQDAHRRSATPKTQGRAWRGMVTAVLVACAMIASARAQTAPQPELYLVAIGDVPVDMTNRLVSYVQTRFQVPIRTLPALRFDGQMLDRQRSQVIADELIRAVRVQHAALVKNPRTRVIAITPFDMYMLAMKDQWRFTFSLRSRDQRVAVVSYARMDPANLGRVPDATLLESRLRKMTSKNIGIIYYGLPTSENPRSAMFGNILGVDDLDRMTEDFNPR
jgi:predicted Zn-dependent protease